MGVVLVTRAMPEAEETAIELRALGHEPILAPLRIAESIAAPFPAERPQAVIVTSRNAIAQGAFIPADWLAVPIYCVGQKTAEAAAKAGFIDIRAADGDALSLGRSLIEDHAAGSRLTYLAGEPRGPELEAALQRAGMKVESLLRYRMHRVVTLPKAATTALATRSVEGVLHFSAESARTFFFLAQSEGLLDAALAIRHFCLSNGVAEAAIKEAGRTLACIIAPQRTGSSLIGALHRELTGRNVR